jgi:hypothetical protein
MHLGMHTIGEAALGHNQAMQQEGGHNWPTRAKASRRDRQEVNTTAWDGDACDGVRGGVAGRDADRGGVAPLRLSMTMHTTDEWRSSCVNRNMVGEGRGGEEKTNLKLLGPCLATTNSTVCTRDESLRAKAAGLRATPGPHVVAAVSHEIRQSVCVPSAQTEKP